MSIVKNEGFGLPVRKKKGVHHPETKSYLVDKSRKDAKKQIKVWRERRQRQIYMKRHYDQIPDDNRQLDGYQNEDFQGGIDE